MSGRFRCDAPQAGALRRGRSAWLDALIVSLNICQRIGFIENRCRVGSDKLILSAYEQVGEIDGTVFDH
jgi:hypothetical protein